MLHFGWINEANACVKQLLACFHGGYLWLDEPVAFTVELISEIMGIPKHGPDPSQYIWGKDNERKLEMTLKKGYARERDGRAYRIDSVNDHAVCIGVRILASKVVRKNWMNQCNSGVVACDELCAQGTHMNWYIFLLNHLVKDEEPAQASAISFTYSWLLILLR